MSNRMEINFMNGVALGLAKHAYKNAPKSIYHTGKWILMQPLETYNMVNASGNIYNFFAKQDGIYYTVVYGSENTGILFATFENAKNVYTIDTAHGGQEVTQGVGSSERYSTQGIYYGMYIVGVATEKIQPQFYSTIDSALNDIYVIGGNT